MEKTFDFGKIDLNGCGRKINKVEVTVELTEDDVFTAHALVWNSKHTDCEIGGQCLDELVEFLGNNETYMKIYNWWTKYHLNDMHAGTERQEEALDKAGITGWASNYEKCCEYLDSIGLLVDKEYTDLNPNGYKFGTGWLKRDIPSDVIQDIRNLLVESD